MEVDGQRLGTLTLSHAGTQADRFEIPGNWLPAGRHTVTLRLGADSTTSYRLVRVRLGTPD